MLKFVTILFAACVMLAPQAYGQKKKVEAKQEQKQETTNDKSVLERMSESLDNRNFSDDMQSLKDGVKKVADKTKEKVEEYTPEVKQFMQSVGEYFKR
jgi:archaellum component FlaC